MFLIAADFVGTDIVNLTSGDSVFSLGDGFTRAIASFEAGTKIFAYHVKNPQHYGVVRFAPRGKVLSLVDSPQSPRVASRCLAPIFTITK